MQGFELPAGRLSRAPEPVRYVGRENDRPLDVVERVENVVERHRLDVLPTIAVFPWHTPSYVARIVIRLG